MVRNKRIAKAGDRVRPLCIDLFCGLGGWTQAFLDEGWRCVGFDIERHDYGTGGYPGELVLQDVRTIHGAQLKDADIIVASPPCQEFSYRAMPWKRAKALGPPVLDINLFWQCWRIHQEACEAAGRYIPLIVENVKGAQPWVGRARWHYGSFYLWGDVPAIMPHSMGLKNTGGSWFGQRDGKALERNDPRDGHKVPSMTGWDGYGKPGYKAQGFNVEAARRYREEQGNKGFARRFENTPMARMSSRSNSRKAASAAIAKIPYPLASWIARTFKPDPLEATA